MCYTCWVEAGKPRIKNKKTLWAAELIDAVYSNDDCGVGGYAHIVLDDWNLDDDDIDFCITQAEKEVYDNIGEQGRLVCLACLRHLKTLTMEERFSALALQDNFIAVE